MSLVEHIAAQRTEHGVARALSWRALGVAPSTFYGQRSRPPSAARMRRERLDAAVKERFEASGGTYGSPRIHARLRRDGHTVPKKTVEASMARQGLNARPKRRGRSLTRPDKTAAPAPDLLGRDFAEACRRLGVTQSTGRTRSALDNTAAESFFSTLQHELISPQRWHTRAQARRDITTWIDTCYNPLRPHSANNMTSPNDHERAQAA